MTLPRERSQERRARGAYDTPDDAAHVMASWLVRDGDTTYLEPSLGDGAFIRAVRDVVAATGRPAPRWVAAELDGPTAGAAVQRGLVTADELRVGDFLEQPVTAVDAVIGNPPFVRLRHLSERARQVAQARAREVLHAPMDRAGSVWMPFVLTMVASLRPGGRMAVVLPLDATYVSYARPLWEHLGRSFGALRVIRTRDRVFADITQDVLILLAEGRGGRTREVSYEAYESLADLVAGRVAAGGAVPIRAILAGERAFQLALLPDGTRDVLAGAAADGRTVPAGDLASFRIGYVSGHQRFFHPPPPIVHEYDLPAGSLRPALVTARRLRGRGLWTSGSDDDDEVDHLWLPGRDLTAGEERYIRRGEVRGIDRGFKTSRRRPWYRVPGVRPPDAVLTVFSDRPMLMLNDAACVASNSMLCVHVRGMSAERFAAAWYNPLTLLSIGMEVRSLGGGMVVMVPGEASRVAVPDPAGAVSGSPGSARVGPGGDDRDPARIDAALRRGDMEAAYDVGSPWLRAAVGREGADLVRRGIETLARWRVR